MSRLVLTLVAVLSLQLLCSTTAVSINLIRHQKLSVNLLTHLSSAAGVEAEKPAAASKGSGSGGDHQYMTDAIKLLKDMSPGKDLTDIDPHPDAETLLKIRATVLYTAGILEKYKIDYWLNRGTLLGAVRSGKSIPWDDDGDVALFGDGEDKLKTLLPQIKNDLARVTQETGLSASADENKLHIDKIWVDFTGPFLLNSTHVYHHNPKKAMDGPDEQQNQTWVKDVLMPLGTCTWYDHKLPCPRDPDRWLARIYGEGSITDIKFPKETSYSDADKDKYEKIVKAYQKSHH
eukprot:GFYU01009161.1.p2 GENE.GFYU01009161.1~~GFYU01009161.1.p2  ORF type:complete len:290 (+),score=79.70 GFYU01009161.1:163-1032(+)